MPLKSVLGGVHVGVSDVAKVDAFENRLALAVFFADVAAFVAFT